MGTYIPNAEAKQKEMLDFIGLSNLDELYKRLPEEVKLKNPLNIPEGKCELDVKRQMEGLAEENIRFKTIFRGAGAYRHYIPAMVKHIGSKERFVTAYTPYQPEISQGILQSIFEYQTLISELTGMDAANASVYDGASASAEALSMCVERKRETAYISEAAHPDYIRTMQTYCYAAGRKFVMVPEKDGRTDMAFLEEHMDETASCFYLQQPNFYGIIEDAEKLGEIAHGAGAKFIMCVNPIALGVLKTPREYGADIAVGEGQPLGIGLNFGGPYLGFMTCTKELVRKLPGRIAGQTKDVDGKRAFVLTLQAREQHIRREKAASNVCSNQALCALTAGAYLTALGPSGLAEVSSQCLSKAHYAAKEISAIPGYEILFEGEFFHEFVTKCPDTPKLMKKLSEKGILGGYPLKGKYENAVLWCFTELNTADEINRLIGILKEGV